MWGVDKNGRSSGDNAATDRAHAVADQATGKGDRLNRAAENAGLRLLARSMMAIGMPLLLGLGGILGTEVWAIVKETQRAVNRIDISLSTIEGMNKLMSSRIEAQERATNRNTDELDKLKERVWSLPAPNRRPP